MRFCVIRHGYYPEDVRVFKEVRALYEAGYSVDVICLRKTGEKRKEIVDGVCVYRLNHLHKRHSLLRYFYEYGISFLKMFVLVTVLFFRRDYKFIQVNTLPDALVFVTIIPRFFGTKSLLICTNQCRNYLKQNMRCIAIDLFTQLYVCLRNYLYSTLTG